MKRRKFAPAAIFLAGLLLAAVAAASVSAATSAPDKATKQAAPVPPGTKVKATKTRQITKVGVSASGATGAKPTPPLPSKQAAQQSATAASAYRKIPKRRTVKYGLAQAAQSVLSYPRATSLPIITNSAHFKGTAVDGLNAFDDFAIAGWFNMSFPSPTICEGNGYAVQAVNTLFQVRSASSLAAITGAQDFLSLFQPAIQATGFDNLLEPDCYYDPDTGHWFLTVGATEFDELSRTGSAVFIAVSAGSTPIGPWNIYVLDTTFDGTLCGAPPAPSGCQGWQPHFGANKNAVTITTDSFDNATGALNGAQLYVLDKSALAFGFSSVNTVYLDLGAAFLAEGLFNDCGIPGGIFCLNKVIPATSPNSMYDTSGGGTQYMMSTFDWFGSIDNRFGFWAITGTSTINQIFPTLNVLLQVATGPSYAFPPLAKQRLGPIPLGNWLLGPPSPGVGPIQTNGDDFSTGDVKSTGQHIWATMNTGVQVAGCCGVLNQRAGILWLRASAQGGFVHGAAGYIANAFQDVVTGAIAVGPQNLAARVIYTLTGNEYFPTAAISRITPTIPPPNIQAIHIPGPGKDGPGFIGPPFLGQSPNDDVCEYGFCDQPYWGNYSGAVTDGSIFWGTTSYIPFPNCSDIEYFITNGTCFGTRAPGSNWGTAIVRTNT